MNLLIPVLPGRTIKTKIMRRFLITITGILVMTLSALGQAPGGVSGGLRTWYKADAITGKANSDDLPKWEDQYTADGAAQDAVQNGANVLAYFGNRQPQYRTAVSRYNFYPYVDFSKQFSSLFAYQAHSGTPDYQWNYNAGATLYQVGAVNNNQGINFGSGLGATTMPVGGLRYENGLPWYGFNGQYYGVARGYYGGTVDDYGWYNTPNPPFNYNYNRAERKLLNNTPYISAISFDKFATYNACCVVGTDATTAIQTRVNGDRWSFGYSYTPSGPSLFIGNEYTNFNAGSWWNGGIPEVILYNRKLNTTQGNEADRVDTYLALKYGVTLYHNYYLSNGVKVWDTACNNSFNKDIAGLARDNASALHQKQSHSINLKPTVTMSVGNLVEYNNASNPSVLQDGYSLIWGSNGFSSSLRDAAALPGGFANLQANTQPSSFVPASCLNASNITFSKRKWMVQEQTGKDLGSVKVYIESKELTCIDWTCPNSAYIVVGSDANLSNPKYYPLSPATGTAGSTTDYVADINFCVGAPNASSTCGGLVTQYFAIVGRGSICNCGGVASGLTVWVRAENGRVYSDTSSSTLKDAAYGDFIRRVNNISGLGDGYWKYDNIDGGNAAFNNALYQAQYLAPSVYSNFNPAISFGSTIFPGFQFTNILSRTSNSYLGNYNFTDTATAFASTYHPTLTPGIATHVWGAGYTGGVPGFFVANGSGQIGGTTSSNLKYFSSSPAMTAKRSYITAWSTALSGISSASSTYYLGVESYPQFYDTIFVDGKRVGQTSGFKYVGENIATLPALYNRHNDLRLRGAHDLDPNLGDWPTSYWAAPGGYVLHDAIYYERLLTPQEKDRVSTYLGIRNGETVQTAQYLASDATVLWDSTAYTDSRPDTSGYTRYNTSISGIGRDDASCLRQRVTRNTADTVVTIALGKIPTSGDQGDIDKDFENDKEFITWGSNGASQRTSITTDMPTAGCLERRLPREYRIHLTGSNTSNYSTQVRWQLDNNLLTSVSATNISLLIDDDGDGDFTTGTVRVIPASSFDPATNSVLFDNVTWTVSGDSDPSNAAMTISWSETLIGKAKLYDNTANGGNTCECTGASVALQEICTDVNNWTYYKDNINNRKVMAINWGNNSVSRTVTLNATTSAASRRKANLNVSIGSNIYDSAAVVGSRMASITLNSGTITTPVKVRMYYNPLEIQNDSAWVTGTSGVNEPVKVDSTWSWFKFDGTVSDVVNTLTASGLPVATNTGSHPLQMERLVADEYGTDDGINYAQFNNIVSFSTFGYIQTYSKKRQVSNVYVNAKVLLEGPLNTSTMQMTTTLNQNGLIPKTQPYGTAPWAYTSTQELVSSIPSTSITDWVLLELHDAANPSVIVAKRAAFVKNDGTIVDLDGVSPVLFAGIDPGNYKVAVRHRNHLGVMLANSYALTGSPLTTALVDFTDIHNDLYTKDAGYDGYEAAQVSNGTVTKWALWYGDANHDGKIIYEGPGSDLATIGDDVVFDARNSAGVNNFLGCTGYFSSDVNMDGIVIYEGIGSDAALVADQVTFNYGLNINGYNNFLGFKEQLP